MTPQEKIIACYDALERLKNGTPRVTCFIGIELDEITNSKVSQEAGFDKGYIKNKKISHQGIVQSILDVSKETESQYLSKAETQRRHDKKIKKLKGDLDRTEQMLEESLAREILLMTYLKELEGKLYKLSR